MFRPFNSVRSNYSRNAIKTDHELSKNLEILPEEEHILSMLEDTNLSTGDLRRILKSILDRIGKLEYDVDTILQNPDSNN